MVVLDFEGQVRARASREIEFALPSDVERFFKERARKLLAAVGVGREKLSELAFALPTICRTR